MTTEQKKEKAKDMLHELLNLIEKEPMEATKDHLNDKDLEHLDRVAELVNRVIGGADGESGT